MSFKKIATLKFFNFYGGPDSKESTFNAEGLDSIHGSGRSPEEGTGYPLQYSCLGESLDRGAYSPRSHKESDMTKQLKHADYLMQASQMALVVKNLPANAG